MSAPPTGWDARHAGPGPERPPAAVLVVHENRGLNPDIRDVVRRFSKAGSIAMGPDGLS